MVQLESQSACKKVYEKFPSDYFVGNFLFKNAAVVLALDFVAGVFTSGLEFFS